MSFNVNFSAKPVIRETANMANDGGGGNLGYMGQGEKDEKQKNIFDTSVFSQMPEADVFGKMEKIDLPEEFSFAKFIAEIIQSIKNLFIKK